MDDNFNIYSKYYNLLYKDKDYLSEVNYVIEKLLETKSKVKSILEFGCGTGGHGLLLKQKGFSVYGLERSKGMVSVARKNGLECEVADISNFELNESFDAVIALFHVISYMTKNESLINTFRNANKHLSKGGVFLFDIWYSPAVYNLKALPRIKRMQDDQLKVVRIAEPVIDVNSNIIDVQFSIIAKDLISEEITDIFESHPMRHFSTPEIGLLAKLTGFELLKAEEFLSGKNPSQNSWGVCYMLKKLNKY